MAATRKATCKIANGSKYNESLVQRGSITLRFSDDAIDHWHDPNDPPRAGHPFVSSDTAIECLLVLRELFQLPYRQTEGLAQSRVGLKDYFGDQWINRVLPKRRTKARLRSKILNRFTRLGFPQFEWS